MNDLTIFNLRVVHKGALKATMSIRLGSGVCVAMERKTGKFILWVLFIGITQWTQPTPSNRF